MYTSKNLHMLMRIHMPCSTFVLQLSLSICISELQLSRTFGRQCSILHSRLIASIVSLFVLCMLKWMKSFFPPAQSCRSNLTRPPL